MHTATHPQAVCAIRAANNLHIWGLWATIRYIRKHSVPFGLFTLARVLRNARMAGL